MFNPEDLSQKQKAGIENETDIKRKNEEYVKRETSEMKKRLSEMPKDEFEKISDAVWTLTQAGFEELGMISFDEIDDMVGAENRRRDDEKQENNN